MLRKHQLIAWPIVTRLSGRIDVGKYMGKMWPWATPFGQDKWLLVGMTKFGIPKVANSVQIVLAWAITPNWFGGKQSRLAAAWDKTERWPCATMTPAGNEKGKHLSQVAPPLPGYFGIEGQERCGAVVEAIGAY